MQVAEKSDKGGEVEWARVDPDKLSLQTDLVQKTKKKLSCSWQKRFLRSY